MIMSDLPSHCYEIFLLLPGSAYSGRGGGCSWSVSNSLQGGSTALNLTPFVDFVYLTP